MADRTKLHFRLDQDEDGYPPVAVESVWSQAAPRPGEYIVDNIPFFTRDATIGDTVRVRDDDGNLWFDGLVGRAANSLIRVVFFDRSAMDGVFRQLESMGCSLEYNGTHRLLAVSIPSGVDLEGVQGYLRAEAEGGKLDYEEAILRD